MCDGPGEERERERGGKLKHHFPHPKGRERDSDTIDDDRSACERLADAALDSGLRVACAVCVGRDCGRRIAPPPFVCIRAGWCWRETRETRARRVSSATTSAITYSAPAGSGAALVRSSSAVATWSPWAVACDFAPFLKRAFSPRAPQSAPQRGREKRDTQVLGCSVAHALQRVLVVVGRDDEIAPSRRRRKRRSAETAAELDDRPRVARGDLRATELDGVSSVVGIVVVVNDVRR